jgi:hypothetical protein
MEIVDYMHYLGVSIERDENFKKSGFKMAKKRHDYHGYIPMNLSYGDTLPSMLQFLVKI